MKQEIEEKLINIAPYMFVLNDKDKTLKERGLYYPISFGFECGDGWEWLLEKLITSLNTIDKNNELVVSQIKEKFGSLRFYLESFTNDHDINEVIHELIVLAEYRSDHTCETCGSKSGKLRQDGWLVTLCDECYNKKK